MAKKGEFKPNAKARSIAQREYNSKPSSKKDRASRNAARRTAERNGQVKKGDGKDIDHRDSNPRNNKKGNIQVMSRSKNRAMNQHDPRQKRRKK